MDESKKVLVTGGAGFIGSHLCEFLLEKESRVICIDNLVTGKKQNISHLLKNKNFVFVEHDITEPLGIEENFSQLYNLASPASPIDYQEKPIQTLLTNSAGVYNLLESAKKNKASFLQASTSEVYGDPLEHPQKESYLGNVNPVGPRSCYDEGKRFAEALVSAYNLKHKLDTHIVRIFNTYGERMRADDGRVIPAFINQALEGKPITVFGDGKQTRSFCYVSDLVRGLYNAMNSSFSEPINLGNPVEFTMLELAEKIISFTNSESKLSFKPLPKDDPKRRKPDISRAKEVLGWEPKIGLEKGLEKTIDFFKGEDSV
jgi:dTDP-glucose 4,6-dehydratase